MGRHENNFFFRFSEFYNDDKNLLDYNCPKKEDFIKKGIGKCYSKAERLFNINMQLCHYKKGRITQ